MTPSHAVKGSRRYRYYVTHGRGLESAGPPAVRIAAHHLETLVVGRIADMPANRSRVTDLLGTADAASLGRAYELTSYIVSSIEQPRRSSG
jgi:site-specific DNA recombinase